MLLRAFYKLFLAVSDVFVQRAGDKYERVPALRSSPARLNRQSSHRRQTEVGGGKMAMSGGGLYLINPPAFFLFNFHAPSHQIEESGSGASQRMFILQANSLFMLILTSQRGSCKLRSKFKKKKSLPFK